MWCREIWAKCNKTQISTKTMGSSSGTKGSKNEGFQAYINVVLIIY